MAAIVKLDIFIRIEGENLIDPVHLRRFYSKIVTEYLLEKQKSNYGGLKLSKSEFDYVKGLGVKSDKITFSSEEDVLRVIK